MLNYLYYKIYKASLKSSIKDAPYLLAPIYFGILISLNLFVIYGFIAKISSLPFILKGDTVEGIFPLSIMVISALYYNRKRRFLILYKYSHESSKKRKLGNFFTWSYVILTILSLFGVICFKTKII